MPKPQDNSAGPSPVFSLPEGTTKRQAEFVASVIHRPELTLIIACCWNGRVRSDLWHEHQVGGNIDSMM